VLRLVIGLVMLGVFSFSNAEEYKEPSHDELLKNKQLSEQAMKEAAEVLSSEDFSKLLKDSRGAISRIQAVKPQINFSDFLEKGRSDRYMQHIEQASKKVSEGSLEGGEVKYPIALVSFSMPDSDLTALIDEAAEIGAAIAIRGLIDDDFEKTLDKMTSLSEKGLENGLLIDPTLFRRFSVNIVPAFILPIEPIERCSEGGCPVPEHVIAKGGASYRYFLEMVSRIGNEKEKKEAKFWLSKYGS